MAVSASSADRAGRLTARARDGGFNWGNIAILAGVPFALLVIGVASTVVDEFPGPDSELHWVAACLGGIAIWTFVAFYNDSRDVRTAIAISMVLTYFSSLFIILLNDTASTKVSSGGAKDLFDGFQNLVLIVVTFYITGKTVESVANRSRSEPDPVPPDPVVDPAAPPGG